MVGVLPSNEIRQADEGCRQYGLRTDMLRGGRQVVVQRVAGKVALRLTSKYD
jgi:hypothetical protein